MQIIDINPRELMATFSAEKKGKTTKEPEKANETSNNASEYVLSFWYNTL